MKKLLAILLILALTISLVACGNDNQKDDSSDDATEAVTESVTEAATESETAAPSEEEVESVGSRTVTVDNTQGWINVYLYYWSDANNKMVEWPGVEMQQNGDKFTSSLPAEAQYIIFNNDVSQTVDIPFDGSVTEFAISDDMDDEFKYYVTTPDGTVIKGIELFTSEQDINDSQLGVEVVGTEVVEDYFKDSYRAGENGDDAYVLKVKNNLSTPVSKLNILGIFIDKNGDTYYPYIGNYPNPDYESDLVSLTTKGDSLKPGEVTSITIRTDTSLLDKFDYRVFTYIADKVKYTNTDAKDWAQQYITYKDTFS